MEQQDLRVTKEEYLEVKQKENLSTEDLEVISRAAEYGFKPSEQSEQAEDAVDDVQQGSELEETTSYNDSDEEQIEADDVKEDIETALKYERELRLQAEREKEFERQKLQEEIEKLKSKALDSENESTKTDVAEVLNVSIDDFDSEYDMMKYKIEQLSEIIATQSVRDPRLDAVLNELEEFKEVKKRELEEQERIRQEKLFRDEIENFWKNVDEMRPGVSFDEAERLFADLKSKTAETFGSDEVDKLFARLLDPAMSEKTKAMFEEKGIEIPKDFYPIYNTLKVYDYMNGYKIDPVTGERKKVKTVNGNIQTLENIETAYYVMDRKNYLVKARRDIAKQTQQQIEKVTGGATVIPSERLDRISTDDTMSQERMANILADIRRDPLSYNRDPEKIRLKQEVYRRLGIR